MSSLDKGVEFDVIMPTWQRRLALLTVSGLIGMIGAYASAQVLGGIYALPIIITLALLAGISAMWSP
jgi:hypothetical protein